MQVHAANKPIDRGNDDKVLHRVAELAVGYSGAELANLLNESAILAVSQPKAFICTGFNIACWTLPFIFVMPASSASASIGSTDCLGVLSWYHPMSQYQKSSILWDGTIAVVNCSLS